jgi:ankyrin repeat protein
VYYPHGPGSSPIRVTDLYQAVMENDEREVLLKHDAKVALRDSWGKSPLDYAKEVKDAAIIKQIEVARAGNH